MNKIFYIGVKAVFVKDKCILFLQNIREIGKNVFWDLPGGKIKEGETIEETLRREVAEETGINNITIGKLAGVYQLPRDLDNDRGLMLLLFLCDASIKDIVLSDEHKEYSWLSKEKIQQEVQEGIGTVCIPLL